jgi:hypothetical protein
MSSFTSRLTAVGLLALALFAGAAQAAPQLPRNEVRVLPRAESSDLIVAVREWLLSLLAPHPLPSIPIHSSLQPKEGSGLDPNGGQH